MSGKSLVPLNGGLTVTAPHTPNANQPRPTVTIDATNHGSLWERTKANMKAKAIWVGKWAFLIFVLAVGFLMLNRWLEPTTPAPIAAKLQGTTTTVSPPAGPPSPVTATLTECPRGSTGPFPYCVKAPASTETPGPQPPAAPLPTVALPRLPPQGQPQRQAPHRQQATRPAPAYQPQAAAPPQRVYAPNEQGGWRQYNQADFDALRRGR